jgi:adenylate cyclase class 2
VRVGYILKIEGQHSFKHKMVELKAKVSDHESLRKNLSAIGAQHVGTFRQTDLYFKVPEGRLKLREIEGSRTAELIYYERENIPGPKRDEAFILRIQEPEELKNILNKILTPLTRIEKVREIYQHQGTQIHLDTVKSLGKFVEFERQTADNPKIVKKDRLILEKLMANLEIDPKNLESLSYSDLPQT